MYGGSAYKYLLFLSTLSYPPFTCFFSLYLLKNPTCTLLRVLPHTMSDAPVIPPHILSQLAGLLAPLLAGNVSNTPQGNQPAPPATNGPNLTSGLLTPNQTPGRSNSLLPSISLYQSSRLPQNSTPVPSAFPPPPSVGHSIASQRPFGHGITTRSQLLPDTRQANSQRLASAAATLPQRTTLAIRGARVPSTGTGVSRRSRGPAGHPPSLTLSSGIEQTMFDQLHSGLRHIRIRSGSWALICLKKDLCCLSLLHLRVSTDTWKSIYPQMIKIFYALMPSLSSIFFVK